MESLRYMPYLSATGSLVTNTAPFENIPEYPDLEKSFQELNGKLNVIRIDADKIARKVGNSKASNMVMLGAASPFISIKDDIIVQGIKTIFQKKGEEIVEMNIEAFRAGRKFAKGHN